MASEQVVPRIALLGGSFNSVHIGHFRIAIEVCEAIRPERLLFIPLTVPPHKPVTNMLPFELRVRMLNAALAEIDKPCDFSVSEVENERDGPSYTVDTLAVLAERYPASRLSFIMGSEDYAQLASWRRWQDIPTLADIIVVDRAGGQGTPFADVTGRLFPHAVPVEPLPRTRECFQLPGQGHFVYLQQPFLEISSSLIRSRFMTDRSLDFLVPESVKKILSEEKDLIRSFWAF